MWRSRQSQPERQSLSPAPVLTPADAMLPTTETVSTALWSGPDPETEGKISGNEDLRIDGTVEEPIALKCYRLTVGRRAEVIAEVFAREVVIYGKVRGKLQARDRIEIKKDGSVVGDLTSARILIEEGAYFRGRVQIERRKTPRGLPQEKLQSRNSG